MLLKRGVHKMLQRSILCMQGTQYATKKSILCRGAFCGPTVLRCIYTYVTKYTFRINCIRSLKIILAKQILRALVKCQSICSSIDFN